MIINDLKKQLLRYSDVFGNEVNSICQLVKAPNALEKSYLEWNQFSNQNIIKEKDALITIVFGNKSCHLEIKL